MKILQQLLIAYYPAFFLFANNIGEANLTEFVITLFFLTVFTITLSAIVNLFLKDYSKTSILTSYINFICFYLFPISEHFIKFTIFGYRIIRVRYIIIPLFLLLLILFKLLKSHRVNRFFSKFLIPPFLILIIYLTVKIFIGFYSLNNFIKEYATRNETFLKSDAFRSVAHELPTLELPDIYFIVLDAYASERSLKEIYGYDNSSFLKILESRGFFIGDSFSNYPQTHLSIPATLNLNYHEKILSKKDEPLFIGLADYMMKNSNLYRLVTARGYKWFTVDSYWGPTQNFPNSKESVLKRFWRRMTYTLGYPDLFLARSIIAPIWRYYLDKYVFRSVVYEQLDRIKKLVSIDGPKLIFSHFVCPHPPFIFDKNGNSIMGQYSLEAYLGQLEFMNSKIINLCDEIINNSKAEPIIILQADHGFAFNDYTYLPSFGILSAYHLPEGGNSKLYKSISPVNNFRLISDYYFKTDFGLLKDESFIWDKNGDFVKQGPLNSFD